MESVKVSKICQAEDEVMENIPESRYFRNARTIMKSWGKEPRRV